MGTPTGIGNYPPGVTDNDPHFDSDEPLDHEDEHDEFDDEMMNCHAFLDGGHYVCMAAGSEDCDMCPFNSELGKTVDECEP